MNLDCHIVTTPYTRSSKGTGSLIPGLETALRLQRLMHYLYHQLGSILECVRR